MFGLGPATLALGATDMRKGFEGPYGLVRDRLAIARQFRMAKQRSFIRQLRSTV
jgi:hypothetical protein